MTNKILSVLLGMFLFLLPTANATSLTSDFSDELSKYVDNLTLNATEATFGQSIDIGLTTKNSFRKVVLTFSDEKQKQDIVLEQTSTNYYSGKINITNSYSKGVHQLVSITLDELNLPIADSKVKFLVADLPTPTIGPISNKSTTLTGTYLANSEVQIFSNNKLLKTLKTDPKGTFVYGIKPIKAYTKISVIGITDGLKSKTTSITVSDVIAPSVLSINSVSDQSQTIVGKSEPSAIVKAYFNKKLIGQGLVPSSGKFSIKIKKQKANSQLELIAFDKSNNQSKSVSVHVLDKTAPSIPTVLSIKENATTISGKTEPNAWVKLYINNQYTSKIKASNTGNYSFKVSKLKAYTGLKIYSIDAAGNQSKASVSEVKSNHPLSNGQLIIVNTQTNKLSYYNKGKLVKTFRVATGKSSTQTPIGKFKVLNKIKNRPWYKENIPGGSPNNPLGKRWLGISAGSSPGSSYGIHGNNNESSIGKSVSHGCIRMHNSEIEWLFEQVKVGTTVIIAKSSNSNGKIAFSYGISIS